MDVGEPHMRRRGIFLRSDPAGEPDTGEHENTEGFAVRVRINRHTVPRQVASSPLPGGRSQTRVRATDEGRPQIRSGSVTDNRQRAHWPR